MDQSRTEYAGIKYLTDLANDNKLDKEGFIAAVNSFAQGAENSGATRTGALAALDLGTAVQEHLSLAKAAAEQSGGFGKAAVDTADNGGIWAQYIHNKDKVDNMGGVSYDGQYNGVIIGGDFADRGKYSSGIASVTAAVTAPAAPLKMNLTSGASVTMAVSKTAIPI